MTYILDSIADFVFGKEPTIEGKYIYDLFLLLLLIRKERIKKVQNTINDSIRHIKRQVMTINHERVKTGTQIKMEAVKQDTKVLLLLLLLY